MTNFFLLKLIKTIWGIRTYKLTNKYTEMFNTDGRFIKYAIIGALSFFQQFVLSWYIIKNFSVCFQIKSLLALALWPRSVKKYNTRSHMYNYVLRKGTVLKDESNHFIKGKLTVFDKLHSLKLIYIIHHQRISLNSSLILEVSVNRNNYFSNRLCDHGGGHWCPATCYRQEQYTVSCGWIFRRRCNRYR